MMQFPPTYYRIIRTDNFDGDYPDEKFVEPLPAMSREEADRVADAINRATGPASRHYWRVVDNAYKLRPGFEP
jgi:hypothetical protein